MLMIIKKEGIMKIYFYIPLFYFFFIDAIDSFKLGVENISPSLFAKVCPHKKNSSCMVGLITNQTGVDQKGVRTIDSLIKLGCPLRYIFAPEHGFTSVAAGKEVHNSVDKKTGIQIVSLYGHGSGKMIAPEHMNNIDYLIFDIQDSGMRHYTYISTLLNTMKLAAEYDKPYVVLDRPNPLAGVIEGPLVEPDLISFISIASIPLRHGMTIGELARYFNKYVLQKPVQLQVIGMSDYNPRHGLAVELVQQLSPNIRSLQSCYGYSFLGLLGEIEPFDVGVGTQMAFRCITLPDKIDVPAKTWKKVENLFSLYGVTNAPYNHVNKKTNREGKGVRLEFSTVNTLCAFELLLSLLQLLKREGIPFSFSVAFDKAVGTRTVQQYIKGTLPEKLFLETINSELNRFYQRARRSFLYKPYPCVKNIPVSFFRS